MVVPRRSYDRSRNFLAETLARYLQLQEIKHLRTSAYHPRTNGKTERYNGLLGFHLDQIG
jgi:transposase InsO family protein